MNYLFLFLPPVILDSISNDKIDDARQTMANYDLASYILPVIVIYIVETNTFYSKNYYTIITILEKASKNIEIS